MKKRILITGSNGLLGQKLVKQLINHPDFDLIATSSGENRLKSLGSFEFTSMDITNETEITTVFEKYKPHVVVNTAAMTNVDACEDAHEQCTDINVNAVALLLKACENHNAHLIHLSTDFVFDGAAGPYKEEDKPNPLSFYGASKWKAEQLLINSEYTNWAIARTIIVYGQGEAMSRSNIVLWAKSALEDGQLLTIVEDQFRSPTLADDLATGCILIAQKNAQGIFHLSGKDQMSILELVQRVAKFFKLNSDLIKTIKTNELNQKAQRPLVTGFILDKAKNHLGYSPLSFEEGLAQLQQELK